MKRFPCVPDLDWLMLKILTVCTANICRSPLAENVLRSRLDFGDVEVTSAGTRAREGVGMDPSSARLAVAHGADAERVTRHTARSITAPELRGTHLALAMSREHRRALVETDPALTGRAFTLRELHRLLLEVDDEDLHAAGGAAGDPPARLAGMLALAHSRRGIALPPASPDQDDVIDPFGRSATTYERSATEVLDALPAVERLIRLARA